VCELLSAYAAVTSLYYCPAAAFADGSSPCALLLNMALLEIKQNSLPKQRVAALPSGSAASVQNFVTDPRVAGHLYSGALSPSATPPHA